MPSEQKDSIHELIKQLKDSTLKSSIENVSMENNMLVKNDNISKEDNPTKRKSRKPLMKQLPETMSSNKMRTTNCSFELTNTTITPDVIRLQKIKNACVNLPNTIDLVDLVAGVTISDGEHLKIGQLRNEQFTYILNTNWNDLDEIPPVKAN